MEEANVKIKQMKSWRITKAAFLKHVEVESWEDAVKKFPLFAEQKKLMKFELKKENDVPQTFKVCLTC